MQASFVSIELMHEVIPSVSAIKVIEIEDNEYVAFEGNSRLYALQKVFDQLIIEVELYVLGKDSKIARRVSRVLKLNQLVQKVGEGVKR